MPININCPTCDQVVSAPDNLAGKRVVCPGCKGTVAIPEKPATSAKSAEPIGLPLVDVEPVPTPPITKADVEQHVADEQAALRVVRIVYVVLRDDWRRLFTCAHLWPVLFLFFLPFVNLSCNGRMVLSQTGLQTCYGGFTIDPRLEQAKVIKDNFPKLKDESVPWSILTVVYILFAFLGSGLGFLCIIAILFRMRLICAGLHLFSLALGAAAFIAIAGQMIVGFPIEKTAQQRIFEKARQERNQPLAPAQPDLGADALFAVDAHYSAWLWLSCVLVFLSVPAFLLEFLIVLVAVVRAWLRKGVDSG